MTVRMLIFFVVGLAAYGPGVAVGAEKGSPWKASVNVGVQFDDNVNTSQTDDTSGQGDKAAVIGVSGLYKIFDSKAFGLEAGYDFYQSLYEDLDAFDLQSHSVSLFRFGHEKRRKSQVSAKGSEARFTNSVSCP